MGRRSLSFISASLFLWLFAVSLAGAQKPAAKPLKNPIPASPASIAAGGAVFRKQCAICHGFKGKGDGPLSPAGSKPANFTDATWDHGSTDVDIFSTITTGVGPDFVMVSFKGKIPDKDLWNIVNFIRTLGPKTAAR